MTPMINFSMALLEAVAIFLGSEPMIYLFSIICLCFIVKLFRSFFP